MQKNNVMYCVERLDDENEIVKKQLGGSYELQISA